MSDLSLTKTELSNGQYAGILKAESAMDQPEMVAVLGGTEIDGLSISPRAGASNNWDVVFTIPLEAVSDGVQTILLVEKKTGITLDKIAIVAGDVLEDDFLTEVKLLRDELDMLKQAFRQHCAKTDGQDQS